MSLDTRVAALDGLLEEAGLDAVLATKDASIAYLTGFWGLQLERFFGVVVKRGGEGALIAPVAGPRERRAPRRRALREDPLQRGRLQRPAGAVRHARRRQADRRRGGPPQLRALEGADRGRATSSSRRPSLVMHLREAKQAEEVEAVRARLRAHPGRLRRAVGRPGDRPHRGRDQRARRVPARPPRRDALRAAHPLRHQRRRSRTARPASASSRPATSSAPTSPPSSTATGAT